PANEKLREDSRSPQALARAEVPWLLSLATSTSVTMPSGFDSRPDLLPSWVHELSFCIIIFFAQLLTQAGLANVLFISHLIAPTLDIPNSSSSSAQLAWLVAAYSMTVGAFMLITGKLGDVYGHKRVFVLGFLWFGLCSLGLGFAVYAGSIYFAVFRALQGIGPAAVLPNAVA